MPGKRPENDEDDGGVFYASDDDILDLGGDIEVADEDADEFDIDKMFAAEDDDTAGDGVELPDDDDDELQLVDDDDPAAGDDDLAKLSPAMRARFQDLEARANRYDQDAQEWEAERQKTWNTLVATRQQNIDLIINTGTQKLADLEAAMVAAHEAGETQQYVKLTGELSRVQAAVDQAKRAKVELDAVKAKGPPARSASAGTGAAATRTPENQETTTPQAADWMARNAGWFNRPELEHVRMTVYAIDKELTRDGLTANTADYFVELDRRLNQRVAAKDLAVMGRRRGRPPANVNGRTAPVTRSTTRSAGQRRPQNGQRIVIDSFDKANMRRFKMDPANPAQVRAYALAKRGRETGDKTVRR